MKIAYAHVFTNPDLLSSVKQSYYFAGVHFLFTFFYTMKMDGDWSCQAPNMASKKYDMHYIANPLKLCDSLCEKKTFCLSSNIAAHQSPFTYIVWEKSSKNILHNNFHRQNKSQVWNNIKTINLRSFKKILKGV